MARLYLLRHAKSDWSQIGLSDHDRQLNERGRQAAAHVGQYAAAHGIAPDIVLCSTAVRARQTLAHVIEAGGLDWDVRYIPELYGAGVSTITQTVVQEAASLSSVLVVGHNPGFHDTALSFAARGNKDLMADLFRKYPTGTLCGLEFDCARLDSIEGRTAELVLFCKPRDLA